MALFETRHRFVALLLVLSALLAACGGSSSDDGDESASPSTPASEEGGSEGSANREATLRIGQNVSARTWDPLQATGAVAAAHVFFMLPYDQLIEYGPDLKPKPMLAEDWTVAEDGMSMTLNLRTDVTFHDGSPFDAEAVKANLERAMAAPAFGAIIATLESVTVEDEATVELGFSAPTFNFADVLAQDVRVSSIVNPAMLNDPSLATKPAGSGPYELVSASTDASVFERVASHWDETSGLAKRIEIRTMLEPNARLAALRSGQIDIAYTTLDQVDEAKNAGVKVVGFTETAAIQSVLFGYSRPNVQDWRVRKAISLALDREAISQTAFGGYCRPSQQIFSQLATGWIEADDEGDALEPNLEEAKSLLEEAGVDSLRLSGLVPSGNTSLTLFAQIVQSQLQELGIQLDLTTQPSSQSTVSFADGQFDLQVTSMNGSPDSQTVVESNLESKGKGFGIPDYLESSIAAAKKLPYGEEGTEAWQEVSREHMEKPTHVPVCNNHTYIGVSDKVIGTDDMAYGRITQGVIDSRRLGIAAG